MNLESVHERGDHEVVTQDHVLDVVVTPDRQVQRKDEDELAAAVTVGRFTAAEAAAFEQDAADVEDVVRRWGQPFCAGWESWAADPTWPLPSSPGVRRPGDLPVGAQYQPWDWKVDQAPHGVP